jgi:hypothetical protein
MSDDPFIEGSDTFQLIDDVTLHPDHDPREIAAELVATDPDHAHLRLGSVNILFLFRRDPKFTQDKIELGSLSLPVFQGKTGALAKWLMIRSFGALPDFVMILDQTFWDQAPREQKVALVDHELTHAIVARNKNGEERFGDDGRPVWAIKPHDLEEFDRIVAKHGAWTPDISSFLSAAGFGGRTY